MKKEMRRNKQALSQEMCIDILQKCTAGVLALSDGSEYPYAVPLSYVYDDYKIYFHCAKEGHKLDMLANNKKVSFCVVAQDEIIPEKYTTYYRSVIVFGKASIISDEEKKQKTIEKLAFKYNPYDKEGCLIEIEKSIDRMHMIELEIDYMSGKEAIELVRMRDEE